MSQSSHFRYEHAGSAASRPQSAASISRHLHRAHAKVSGYTLTHAGRQIRIGPVAFWIVVGALVAMAVWSILTGTYFAFHDDVLTRLIGRQAAMQFAYEDRIAELRGQVDRITSRQLLDQEQFEKKLKVLLRRQAMLEKRTAEFANDGLTTGSIKPSRIAPPRAAPARGTLKPKPINDTVLFVAPPDREARLQSREIAPDTTRFANGVDAGGVSGLLARVSLSLDKVEHTQTVALSNLEETVDTKARRIHSVLADLGVQVGQSRRRHGRRRPVHPAQGAACERRRIRAPDLPYQRRPCPNRSLHPHPDQRAGAQAGRRPRRHDLAFRRTHRPVLRPARHA